MKRSLGIAAFVAISCSSVGSAIGQQSTAVSITFTGRQELVCHADFQQTGGAGTEVFGQVSVFCNNPSGMALTIDGAGVQRVNFAGDSIAGGSGTLTIAQFDQATLGEFPILVELDRTVTGPLSLSVGAEAR